MLNGSSPAAVDAYLVLAIERILFPAVVSSLVSGCCQKQDMFLGHAGALFEPRLDVPLEIYHTPLRHGTIVCVVAQFFSACNFLHGFLLLGPCCFFGFLS